MRHFDLCVIGSGPGGQKAAIQAAKLGKNVCVVERMEMVGGVAINTGTIPSKAFREATLRLIHGNDPLSIKCEGKISKKPTIKELMTYCKTVIETEIRMIEAQLARNGVTLIQGHARFIGDKELFVKGVTKEHQVTADKYIIAVGTYPARPDNIPFNGRTIITSDDLLFLEKLPDSIVVVGGGVIGTEYASTFAALGVHVVIVDPKKRLVEFVDREIGDALQNHLVSCGVEMRFGVEMESVKETHGSKDTITTTFSDGSQVEADCLLYCLGRQGATEDLGLDLLGISPDHRGRIKVDDDYCTSNRAIFAVGDVIGFPALASTSMDQGRVAACKIYGAQVTSLPQLFPYGIYSIPEISMVGKSEAQLKASSIPFESGVAHYNEVARGQLIGDDTGMLKILFNKNGGTILGVHAFGTGATELIHIGQAVMALGGTLDYFINTAFNYPTLAESYKIAALDGANKIKNKGEIQ